MASKRQIFVGGVPILPVYEGELQARSPAVREAESRSDYRAAFSETLVRFRRRAMLVIITLAGIIFVVTIGIIAMASVMVAAARVTTAARAATAAVSARRIRAPCISSTFPDAVMIPVSSSC